MFLTLSNASIVLSSKITTFLKTLKPLVRFMLYNVRHFSRANRLSSWQLYIIYYFVCGTVYKIHKCLQLVERLHSIVTELK